MPSTIEEVRKVTGLVRPGGDHGCRLEEVVPGLWIAHYHAIQDNDAFTRLGLSPPMGLVVNSAVAYNQCPAGPGHWGPDIEVLQIDVFDDPKEGEAHTAAGDAKKYFPLVNSKIKAAIGSGKSALVHCMGSISRAVVFIIAYLMEAKSMSVVEATAITKAKWSATWPCDAFVRQLIEFEAELAARK